ncbi:MAG TPA: protein tyrosine phosphatase [Gammaproteobacteria bacterium]|nr:protein tyrosine phosphatase [Gammaproteobacteria bacterium]
MQPELFLVFDRADTEAKIAKKYRSCPDLRASASGQFSADELANILRVIPAERQDIWILDLRQESHGFIDGLPVSWVTDRNIANLGKNALQIEQTEKKLLQDVAQQKTVTVYALKKLAGGKVAAEEPMVLVPESVETEQQLVAAFNAKYARIYALDHNKPDDVEVDNFINFVKNKVKTNDWLHFHCRGGGGRSSTFIAMYDMLRNAQDITFIEIMQRQAQMGNIKLSEMPTTLNKIWKADAAQERYAFLCKFYAYVLDPEGFQTQNWSAWQKLQARK